MRASGKILPWRVDTERCSNAAKLSLRSVLPTCRWSHCLNSFNEQTSRTIINVEMCECSQHFLVGYIWKTCVADFGTEHVYRRVIVTVCDRNWCEPKLVLMWAFWMRTCSADVCSFTAQSSSSFFAWWTPPTPS